MTEIPAVTPATDSSFSTPMMQQYLALKREYPDCILLFRLGDFYEMFLDDAVLGAKILGITLTSRTRGKDGRIPMAGVPYHAVEGYVAKLLAAGHKVAMCDQVTPPKAGELVDRQVTRVLTPGTLLSDHLLHATQSALVGVALCTSKEVGIALADIASGKIYANVFNLKDTQLIDLLNKISTLYEIREWLVKEAQEPDHIDLTKWLDQHSEISVTIPSRWVEKKYDVHQTLARFFSVGDRYHDVLNHPASAQAVAVVMEYLLYTQKTPPSHCQILPLLGDSYLQLDAASIRHLEILPTSNSDTSPTLFGILNRTQTAAGSRQLRQWLLRPLADLPSISERQKAIDFFLTTPLALAPIQLELQRVLDIERLVTRLTVKTGSPRDVVAIAQSLHAASQIDITLATHTLPSLLQAVTVSPSLRELATQISHIIADEPPLDPRQGGVIRTGVNSKLDQWRRIATNQREYLSDLEQSLRASTTISSLKVRYNQVFGFYIEVSKNNLNLVPNHFVRKQTLVNAERFTTPELAEAEAVILKAETDSADLEYQLFLELVDTVLTHTLELQHLAAQVAQLDCLQSLAVVALEHHYVAPTFNTEGLLELTACRHPVLETLPHITSFVPNDVTLNHQHQQLVLLSGPNMAGKSVLMRQVALITLLAHIGSSVPAKQATIPLTDRIFVRSGAGDAMAQGLSTFMVEMVETAEILHHATERSLVIMDEIGRGTSTHDGISLAWAIAEFLVTQRQPGPLTLFATHYHELQELAGSFPEKIKNFHLAITEHAGKLVFLYSLQEGGASQSHGLKVAELAGVPEWVIKRAAAQLDLLQTDKTRPDIHTALALKYPDQATDLIITQLRQLPLNELTPVQALVKLSELQQQLQKENKPT